MENINQLESKSIEKSIINFIEKHKDGYTKEEIDFIKNNALWPLYCKYTTSILEEIYDELGILPSDRNVYLQFLNMIDQLFGLDKNIIEIGAGKIPTLAKHISLKQNSGTITIYDNKILTSLEYPKKLIVKREKFSSNTLLKPYNLMIGFMPEDISYLMVQEACKNKMDFIIGLSRLYYDYEEETYPDLLTERQQDLVYKCQQEVKDAFGDDLKMAKITPSDYSTIPVIYYKKPKCKIS